MTEYAATAKRAAEVLREYMIEDSEIAEYRALADALEASAS